MLRVLADGVLGVQVWLELLQGDGMGAGNPLVDWKVLKEPFQDEAAVPWIRLVFTVQDQGLLCAHCVVV